MERDEKHFFSLQNVPPLSINRALFLGRRERAWWDVPRNSKPVHACLRFVIHNIYIYICTFYSGDEGSIISRQSDTKERMIRPFLFGIGLQKDRYVSGFIQLRVALQMGPYRVRYCTR